MRRRRFGRRPSALRRRASIDDEEATKGAADEPTGLLYPMYVMASSLSIDVFCLQCRIRGTITIEPIENLHESLEM